MIENIPEDSTAKEVVAPLLTTYEILLIDFKYRLDAQENY